MYIITFINNNILGKMFVLLLPFEDYILFFTLEMFFFILHHYGKQSHLFLL